MLATFINFGIPSIGFFADYGREFDDVKMDKFTLKFGIIIKFGPAYNLWSNGIN